MDVVARDETGELVTGRSNIAEQVAGFFAEIGLLPVVSVRRGAGWKVHAAFPETPFTPICPNALKRGTVMRSATREDLLAPPCRGCITRHIWLIRRQGPR